MKKIGLALSLLLLCACAPDYSSGFRVGVVQKSSYKGIFNKSFEGEIVLDGFKMKSTDAGSTMTNVWAFSATDPTVIEALQKAANDGSRVKLTYKQWLLHSPLNQQTSYTVTRVDEVK